MTSLFRKVVPSPRSIQREYVKKRQRALFQLDTAKVTAVSKVIAALAKKYNHTTLQDDEWVNYIDKLAEYLQHADLTINLDAGSWFSAENKYKTYTQMYERAVDPSTGKMLLKSTKGNPADTRAASDDVVTIPDSWANAHAFSQRKRIYQAMVATGTTMQEKKRGKTGNLWQPSPNDGTRPVEGTTLNKRFMPKAKQVFAALNYGRRPHGATTAYGHSYIVLRRELKRDAIYFPADSFDLADNYGTSAQETFYTIVALLAYGYNGKEVNAKRLEPDQMCGAIWESCWMGRRLGDCSKSTLLLEAHLFRKIKVAQDIEALHLARDEVRDAKGNLIDNATWQRIETNAREWCSRNHIRFGAESA